MMRKRKGWERVVRGSSLGALEKPRPAHVVCAKLLRRLLQEAYDKGCLKQDDSELHLRVRAALDVSRSISGEFIYEKDLAA